MIYVLLKLKYIDKIHVEYKVNLVMKNNTINKKEIEKFSRIAEEWWNPEGKFKPLHKFNPIRISYIKNNVISSLKLKNKRNKPLEKVKILDVGCGGGLLSEPMSRLGADVVGIDASDKNINVAKLHAKKNNLKIKYFCTSPENLDIQNKFDVILNMEIVEHVEDIDFFLESCSKLLKKKGIMFVATLNKTLKSYLFAIIGAEYILRWLPIGTHEWEKFVKPEDLVNLLKKQNLKLENLDGMKFNILNNQWDLSSDKSINYIGKFIKN
jgi:2-polyprenyl-6-hydroxyphenyl methylase/3-demethylubiquinone-9 3-methyltransferase